MLPCFTAKNEANIDLGRACHVCYFLLRPSFTAEFADQPDFIVVELGDRAFDSTTIQKRIDPIWPLTIHATQLDSISDIFFLIAAIDMLRIESDARRCIAGMVSLFIFLEWAAKCEAQGESMRSKVFPVFFESWIVFRCAAPHPQPATIGLGRFPNIGPEFFRCHILSLPESIRDFNIRIF